MAIAGLNDQSRRQGDDSTHKTGIKARNPRRCLLLALVEVKDPNGLCREAKLNKLLVLIDGPFGPWTDRS